LAKKQRLSRVRTTGLKSVKTPNSANSESSLPTPDITGGEEPEDEVDQIPVGDEEDEEEDDDGDELEAMMLGEFDKDDDDE
jgi:RNA polymerase II subunit A-like phosphatase